jgi:multidrug efflux pump subunit AcrB
VSLNGKTATLGSLATVIEQAGQTEIRRENLLRVVTVTARLDRRDLGSGMADVQKVVAGLHLPSTIRIEYGGQYAEQQSSFHDLVFVLILAVLLVFIVLLFEFGSFAAPIAVLASALLSTFRRFPSRAGYLHHFQPLLVHGPDHGDRHRRQERHPVARC